MILQESPVQKLICVSLEIDSGRDFPAIISQLSRHEMEGTTSGFLAAFDMITIFKAGYGRLRGEVRWTDGDNFAVRFVQPIDLQLFCCSDPAKTAQSPGF